MSVIQQLLSPESGLPNRFFFLARRFVAGENASQALAAIAALNADGIAGSLDYLGEDVTRVAGALAIRDIYLRLLDEIAVRAAKTNISVKLTALGLLIDEAFCVENLRAIVARAARNADPFVRIDMEGSGVTDATFRVFDRVFEQHHNVGVVIQAYLRRSRADVERMIECGARVRLCKGAYNESNELAYGDMATIRREFLRLAEALLTRGRHPGIATHDEKIIDAVKAFARERGIAPERFEFQLLYGVRPDLQRSLRAQGYNVRVYVPFGTHWAGYFYRRVSERRENALFALRSILGR